MIMSFGKVLKSAYLIAVAATAIMVLYVINSARAVDFTARCSSLGVIHCLGLDTSGEIDNFVYGDDLGNIYGVLDTSISSSGSGSLKFTVPTNSSANSSGAYQRVIDELGNGFGEGDTFYVQFRQRFSEEVINEPMGGNGWKQIVLSTMFGGLDDPADIGLFNKNMAGYPALYFGDGTVTLDQNPADSIPVAYVADQWMTFYLEVHIGTWSNPDSIVRGWVGLENQPLKQVFDHSNITLTPGFDPYINRIELTPHNTNKSNSINHLEAQTWYDELIVSNQPIEDPVDPIPSPTVSGSPAPSPSTTPTPTPTPTPSPTVSGSPAPSPSTTPTPNSGGGGGGGGGGSGGSSPTPIPTPTPSSIPSPTPRVPPGQVRGASIGNPDNLSIYNLKEGDTISAVGSNDPDIYIVNEWGYKRLFLNPVIFNFYAHLGWAKVKNVTGGARDVFPTSGLFRNCETNDLKVYATEITGEDVGTLHWMNMTGGQAVAEDPEFFKKVFCINNNEFNWYPASPNAYISLSQVPVYSRD